MPLCTPLYPRLFRPDDEFYLLTRTGYSFQDNAKEHPVKLHISYLAIFALNGMLNEKKYSFTLTILFGLVNKNIFSFSISGNILRMFFLVFFFLFSFSFLTECSKKGIKKSD